MSTLALHNARFYRAGEYHNGSVLIAGGRVKAVSEADIAAGDAEDLTGSYLLPGFVDTHFHFTTLAVKRSRCDLSTAESAAHVVELLNAYAPTATTPHIMGVGWDDSAWADGRLPTRAMLDSVDAARPLFARRICGHIGVVNSALLEQLEPHATLIDRDTGEVREHAAWQANAICKIDDATLSDNIGAAIVDLYRLGVTGIHDIVEPARFEAYFEGVQRSPYPLAIDILLHTEPAEFDRYVEVAARYDAPQVRLVGVKCFLDGSLGGRTAALHDPYADGEGRGTLLMEAPQLESVIRGCAEHELTCAMHAIGDRAIDTILDVLERVAPQAGYYRIEHCEMTGVRQIERLAQAPVFVAMQPNFVRYWGQPGGMYEQRVGAKRFAEMNRFRTLSRAGVDVIFGSDGMPPGPLIGLSGATRHPIEPERLTTAETVNAFTAGADRVGRHGRGAGVIEPGATADLVVWDRDPLSDEGARVKMTICGGAIVWRAPH